MKNSRWWQNFLSLSSLPLPEKFKMAAELDDVSAHTKKILPALQAINHLMQMEGGGLINNCMGNIQIKSSRAL